MEKDLSKFFLDRLSNMSEDDGLKIAFVDEQFPFGSLFSTKLPGGYLQSSLGTLILIAPFL